MACSLCIDVFTAIIKGILQDKFSEIDDLTTEQYKALWAFTKRKDVFAILPTGHGKSLIFQIMPDLCRRLNELNFQYPSEAILLVVCPLNSLIDSHLKELEKHGISATCLLNDKLDEVGILAGKYSILFANPESLIKNSKWREMLRSEIYQNNLFGVVTDEAHVIPKWGQNDTKEKQMAFRECFGRLGELRSLLPGAPILALTATATNKIKKHVIESLSLKKDMVLIDVNPNRPNIYLSIKKITNDLSSSFQWLVDKLKKEMVTMGRVLIYCKTIKDCGRLFTYFKHELGNDAYYPPGAKQVSSNMLVGMYHHSTLPKHKEIIINSLHDTEGVCKIVIATNALGMGVNFKNIRTVIHYGPPRHMDDFIQEIGRAGRDNLPAMSILMYNGKLLRKCDSNIKLFASNSEQCSREILLGQFATSFMPHDTLHNCCTVCHKKCSCIGPGLCSVNVQAEIDLPTPPLCSSSPKKRSRVVNKEQKTLLLRLLLDMKQHIQMSDNSYFLSPDSSTGFSDSLIDVMVKNCKYIFDLDYITKNFPVFSEDHAVEILHIIKDVFGDIENSNIPEASKHEDQTDGKLQHVYNLEYGGEYSQDMEKLNEDTSDCDVNDLLMMSDSDE